MFRSRAPLGLLICCALLTLDASAASKKPSASLKKQIETILAQPDLARGFIGIQITSLKTGKSIFSLNAEKMFTPASNTKLFTTAGVVNITAFISPYRADRDQARRIMSAGEFIEVYVECALAECERRDPKGHYKKARAGEMKEFTGVSAPYEPPLNPELVLRTTRARPAALAAQVVELLDA